MTVVLVALVLLVAGPSAGPVPLESLPPALPEDRRVVELPVLGVLVPAEVVDEVAPWDDRAGVASRLVAAVPPLVVVVVVVVAAPVAALAPVLGAGSACGGDEGWAVVVVVEERGGAVVAGAVVRGPPPLPPREVVLFPSYVVDEGPVTGSPV